MATDGTGYGSSFIFQALWTRTSDMIWRVRFHSKIVDAMFWPFIQRKNITNEILTDYQLYIYIHISIFTQMQSLFPSVVQFGSLRARSFGATTWPHMDFHWFSLLPSYQVTIVQRNGWFMSKSPPHEARWLAWSLWYKLFMFGMTNDGKYGQKNNCRVIMIAWNNVEDLQMQAW